MPKARPSVSVFFPAYNDAGTIASLVILAHMTVRKYSDDYEVIVVNDGSPDHTGELLDEMARVNPWLKVVHHAKNRGYGGALRTGFETASKELVLYTDGDAQYDPREFALLLDAYSDDVDFVNGYKISRNDPFHRKVIGRVYHHFVKLAFGLKVRDVDCDFRLIRRACFDAVTLTSPDGTLPLELVKKFHDAGFTFTEVPVHHFHRVYGQSQFFNWRRLVRVAREIGRMWWRLVVRKEHLAAREVRAARVDPR